MKVLSSWLHEFLDASVAPEAIAAAFDDLGTPVEEETRLGEGLDGIVAAEVLAVSSMVDITACSARPRREAIASVMR